MPTEATYRPWRRAAASLGAAMLTVTWTGAGPALAQAPALSLKGDRPQVMFDADRDRCASIDTPDLPPRVFRDASGTLNMFTLHYVNRALRGPDLADLKIDCHVALNSSLDAEPAHYDDHRYLAATWTNDGTTVSGILHHEYHADSHHRCSVKGDLGCWYNSLIAVMSTDGGRTFSLAQPPVVASAPFPAAAFEGRHRGFFNPTNIVSDGHYQYMLAATTGWPGQPYGICLFRTRDPSNPAQWRAWDGKAFSVRYRDPYAPAFETPQRCAIIEPFLFAVGSITRHRASGQWVTVWMAKAGAPQFPVSGIYYATSRDLKTWSNAHLLRQQQSFDDNVCEGSIAAYPTLIDETASGRNFDDTGDAPWLYYTSIQMTKCHTANRQLVRERASLKLQKTGRAP